MESLIQLLYFIYIIYCFLPFILKYFYLDLQKKNYQSYSSIAENSHVLHSLIPLMKTDTIAQLCNYQSQEINIW